MDCAMSPEFQKFISKHWGGPAPCARDLGVTRQTVVNWMTSNPRGILKHAPEIVARHNVTWTQLSGEVLYAEGELTASNA